MKRSQHLAASSLAALGLALLSSVAAAQDVYRLGPGDVVEVSLGWAPEMKQRIPVQMDGTVSVPTLGTITLAGLTIQEMRTKLQAAAAERGTDLVSLDPHIGSNPSKIGEVTAAVVEYRPIYVNGNVRSSGEHPYRPNLTVRQAITLSGGYGFSSSMTPPSSNPDDLKRDLQSAWAELVREQIHSSRLQAEMDGKDTFDPNQWRDSALPDRSVSELISLEQRTLETRIADERQERAFLQQAIKQADAHIATLTEQQQQEELGVQADAQELERVKKLYETGSIPSPRISETRRALLLSSTRKLQTAVELMQVRRQREDYLRQLDKNQNQRKVDLLRELSDSKAKQADLNVKIAGLDDKLRMTGSIKPSTTATQPPSIVVVREQDQGWKRIVADENTALMPGDVVEVTIPSGLRNGY